MTCFPLLCGKKVSSIARRDPDIDEELSGLQNVRLFTYKELRNACDNFSSANKIGEGGFGSVYKVTKPLQVLLLSPYQMVWSLFFPEISDFGLAKLILSHLTHVSTRVAGTIGYLAPEYAIRGQLTRKADIYSFGVLLVEIVSGRCNTNARLPIGDQFILEKTWELYEKGELVGLVDISLNDFFDAEEACRILKIALLCTQDNPKLRPSMSSVVKMLIGEIDVGESKITKPSLISDIMDLKVKEQKGNDDMKISSSYSASSASDSQGNTMSFAANTTFTVQYD
ncbi:hypothetical protein TanjilG_18679 [Lupinus angustifolius]|uniref:Protein kinase domain-containing protein n=1 Tax=Lupinus angustifolius TaxID=3871 RepID=A0A1J7HAX9_LUPAN|nr:hypothetical protein TanjilG_18679 [Lupinus angustifolius]